MPVLRDVEGAADRDAADYMRPAIGKPQLLQTRWASDLGLAHLIPKAPKLAAKANKHQPWVDSMRTSRAAPTCRPINIIYSAKVRVYCVWLLRSRCHSVDPALDKSPQPIHSKR